MLIYRSTGVGKIRPAGQTQPSKPVFMIHKIFSAKNKAIEKKHLW